MGWEYSALKHEPEPLDRCPLCGAVFACFMRGVVANFWRKLLRLEYMAVICSACKEIVGWEQPYTFEEKRFHKSTSTGDE